MPEAPVDAADDSTVAPEPRTGEGRHEEICVEKAIRSDGGAGVVHSSRLIRPSAGKGSPESGANYASAMGLQVGGKRSLPKTERAARQQGSSFLRENSSNGGKAIRTFWLHSRCGGTECQE